MRNNAEFFSNNAEIWISNAYILIILWKKINVSASFNYNGFNDFRGGLNKQIESRQPVVHSAVDVVSQI